MLFIDVVTVNLVIDFRLFFYHVLVLTFAAGL